MVLVLACFIYFIFCGITTAIMHHLDHYIAKGPHILFAIVFWPVTIPCIIGYYLPKHILSRLNAHNRD